MPSKGGRFSPVCIAGELRVGLASWAFDELPSGGIAVAKSPVMAAVAAVVAKPSARSGTFAIDDAGGRLPKPDA